MSIRFSSTANSSGEASSSRGQISNHYLIALWLIGRMPCVKQGTNRLYVTTLMAASWEVHLNSLLHSSESSL